jgi:hypothetical protein
MRIDDIVGVDAMRCELECGRVDITVDRLSGGQLVAFYLMASYLYYKQDISLMRDDEYDRLCVRLDAEWDQIVHPHKVLIDRGALTAGTGYYVKKYPVMVMNSAHRLIGMRTTGGRVL